MLTSASSAATRPAPTAGPCTADTIGFEQSMTLTTRSRASRIVRRRSLVVGDHRVDQLEAPAGREPLAGALQDRHRASAGRGRRRATRRRAGAWAAGPTAFRPGASSVIRSTPVRGSVEASGPGSRRRQTGRRASARSTRRPRPNCFCVRGHRMAVLSAHRSSWGLLGGEVLAELLVRDRAAGGPRARSRRCAARRG